MLYIIVRLSLNAPINLRVNIVWFTEIQFQKLFLKRITNKQGLDFFVVIIGKDG